MARLFKTIDEIKEFCPMIGSSDFINFAPFIDQAERDFIKPYIGKELYDDIVAAYNTEEGSGSGTSISAEQTLLLLKIQSALAFYMEYLWIPSGQVSIGDSGIRVSVTETNKPAFAWQIKDLRRECLRMAGSAMDDLLLFLEENKIDYPLWTESEAYLNYKSTFIASAKEFTKYFAALGNSRMNFLAIYPTIQRIEEFIIQSELGKTFYDELKAEFQLAEQGSGISISEANIPVIIFIKKTVAQLTMAQAIRELSAQIDERGIIQINNSANSQVVDAVQNAIDTTISKLETGCERDGRAYLLLLKNFLKDNIDNYPTYKASTSYDSNTTNQAFKSGADDKNFAMI